MSTETSAEPAPPGSPRPGRRRPHVTWPLWAGLGIWLACNVAVLVGGADGIGFDMPDMAGWVGADTRPDLSRSA